jgi:secondary thiamine-phosphate synthase enzyme
VTALKWHTEYLWFDTPRRVDFIEFTDKVASIVKKSGVKEGFALVSAMHTTATVFLNDAEDGLLRDMGSLLEKLAPEKADYNHNKPAYGSEKNGHAHLRRLLCGHQELLPITGGKLDLGPWERLFYGEFDGQRKKRVLVKVFGE